MCCYDWGSQYPVGYVDAMAIETGERATLPALAVAIMSPPMQIVFVLSVTSAVMSTIESAILAPSTVLSNNLLVKLLPGQPLLRLSYASTLVIAAAIALLVAVLAGVMARLFARPKAEAPELRRTTPRPRTSRVKPPASDAVFVSYARANDMTVLPLVEAAKRAGRKFWLDQQGISAGDGWAGEIVRAIKAAGGVVVMCSNAAFESDHVKREIYLADRYKKKLAPVFVEAAEPPEDFEYFFAGVQPLRLFETPEAERPQALIRVLG